MRARSRHWLVLAVLGLALVGSVVAVRFFSDQGHPDIDPKVRAVAIRVSAIEKQEEQVARTVWAKELLAEQCGRVFEELWDNLNRASNRWDVLKAFPAGAVVSPKLGNVSAAGYDISVREQVGPGESWNPAQTAEFLSRIASDGWQIARTEFRHLQFDTDAKSQPSRSGYYVCAHLVRPAAKERAILEGGLSVHWVPGSASDKPPRIERIEFSQLSLRSRIGAPGFKETFSETVAPPEGSFFIDPAIVYDLDGDGTPEIIMAAKNLVYRRDAKSYFALPLCRFPPGLIFTGVIADFDGDGAADFLCARFEGLYLFKGSPQGTFDEPGRLVWSAQPHLKYAQALTCGDIDGDGDLDVWLGQYKPPYDRGQMPTPYYDANDGYPSYLLRNDGHGNFTDATAGSGLTAKRWRRVYGASFADLNDDHHLDLVTTSDFAGLELYLNDGAGHFTNVTEEYLPEHRGFGMSHTLADFDGDGRTDLLMIGMDVPVAERLIHAGCGRPGYELYAAMLAPMSFGNRLFLHQENGRYTQSALGDSISHTGWSWAAGAFDLDNDGLTDLYVTNGHETKESVRDYETEFWLHDIFVGNSRDDLTAFAYFQSKAARTRGRGMSYGGYEKNRLFLNRGGKSFLEVAHLMGVGMEEDSRCVVAEDLDGDGREDLLVTTFEAWPANRQTLRVFSNVLPQTNHWVGFRLREQSNGISPLGARVTIRYGERSASAQLVVGEGYRSQRSNTAHFGLGQALAVESALIEWRDGRSVRLEQPHVDQYHTILLPDEKAAARK